MIKKSALRSTGGGSATNTATGTIEGGYFGLLASNTASSTSVVNFGSIFSVQARYQAISHSMRRA